MLRCCRQGKIERPRVEHVDILRDFIKHHNRPRGITGNKKWPLPWVRRLAIMPAHKEIDLVEIDGLAFLVENGIALSVCGDRAGFGRRYRAASPRWVTAMTEWIWSSAIREPGGAVALSPRAARPLESGFASHMEAEAENYYVPRPRCPSGRSTSPRNAAVKGRSGRQVVIADGRLHVPPCCSSHPRSYGLLDHSAWTSASGSAALSTDDGQTFGQGRTARWIIGNPQSSCTVLGNRGRFRACKQRDGDGEASKARVGLGRGVIRVLGESSYPRPYTSAQRGGYCSTRRQPAPQYSRPPGHPGKFALTKTPCSSL